MFRAPFDHARRECLVHSLPADFLAPLAVLAPALVQTISERSKHAQPKAAKSEQSVSGAFYSCAYADAEEIIEAYQAPLGRVERAVPALRANIVFKTQHGIGFGSTPDDVRRVYGPAPLQHFSIEYLAYQKVAHDGSTTISTVSKFFFMNGHLIGLERSHGV